MDQAKNFAKATLAATIDADDLSLTVVATEGLRFPTPPFNAVVWNSTDYPDPADDPAVEIVRVTAISTDTLTITRAQEGTAASEHNVAGKTYQIIAPLTAKVINTDLAPVGQLTDSGTEFVISDNEASGASFNRGTGVTTLGDHVPVGEGTKITINDSATTVTITKALILPDLPSTDPAVAGQLYYDSGTGVVKRSAG